MTRVQAVTRRVHERGVEWISAPGVRIGDGVPRVRREPEKPETAAEAATRSRLYELLQNHYAATVNGMHAAQIRDWRTRNSGPGILGSLFGSGNLWIALVFGITLLK